MTKPELEKKLKMAIRALKKIHNGPSCFRSYYTAHRALIKLVKGKK